MFAKTLSLALFGLVALPSFAAARPAARSDDARAVASQRAAARTEGGEGAARMHGGRVEGLCARLACTPEQVTAIRATTHELRERLAAERNDDGRMLERVKELRKDGLTDDELTELKTAFASEHRAYERLFHEAVLEISKVLDDEQRARFMVIVDRVGAKNVLGVGGRSAKGKSYAARMHTHGKRDGAAKLDAKRDTAAKGPAKGDMKRERVAKSERKLAKSERKLAKSERKLAKSERKRQSAKA